MSGGYNVVSGEIETPTTFMTSGVSEEDTMSGPVGQFVGNLCGEVGIANTAKNAQLLIRWCGAVKSNIWVGDTDCLAREAIQ
jgi:hypothetical protein